jgi:hypothetical protein
MEQALGCVINTISSFYLVLISSLDLNNLEGARVRVYGGLYRFYSATNATVSPASPRQ